MSTAIGWAFLRLVWRRRSAWPAETAVRLFLAVAVGLGVTSQALFLLLSAGAPAETMVWVDVSLFAVLVGLLPKAMAAPAPLRKEPTGTGPLEMGLGLALLLASAWAAWALWRLSENLPHGPGDSWAIWNMRARFIYRGGGDWRSAFEMMPWSHLDYPLLLPLSVVRLWLYGGESTAGPILLATGVTATVAALLVSALWMTRSLVQGLLGGVVLLSSPAFLIEGASQCADIPLSLYILATAACFRIGAVSPERRGAAQFTAGLSAGLAAWTKNEGLAFAVLFGVVVLGSLLVASPKPKRPAALLGLVGLALPVVPLALFKLVLAPPSEFIDQGTADVVARALDVSRHLQILGAVGREVRNFAGWDAGAFVLPVLVLYLVVMGRSREALNQGAIWPVAALLLLTLAAYYAAYLTSPYDLEWHMKWSLGRLLLQIWPTTLFLAFSVARRPGEGATRTPREPANRGVWVWP